MTDPDSAPLQALPDVPPCRPVQVVAVALVDDLRRPTRLLAAQRARPEALRGLWEFPGGKQEPGEQAEEAVRRECREELGCEVRLGAEVVGPLVGGPGATGWPLNDRAAMRLWWAEAVEEPRRQPEDHLELRWCSWADQAALLSLDWIPADRPVLDALLSGPGPGSGSGAGAGHRALPGGA